MGGEVLALDLLVVLQLGLEEARHLHGGAGGARDPDRGEVIGLEDLLDAAVGDLVALAGLAVARDHHAVTVAEGEHGRAVGHRRPPSFSGHRRLRAGQEMGCGLAQVLDEAGG
jgi:hypothetical protein